MALALTTQTAVTASGNSGALSTLNNFERIAGGIFLLNVSSAAAVVGDTLDVYVQSSIDGGTTWDDFIHFTQVLGNGGAKKFVATWRRDGVSPTSALHAAQDAALSAGVNQGQVGPTWRVKWVVGGSSPSFNFTLTLEPQFLAR